MKRTLPSAWVVLAVPVGRAVGVGEKVGVGVEVLVGVGVLVAVGVSVGVGVLVGVGVCVSNRFPMLPILQAVATNNKAIMQMNKLTDDFFIMIPFDS